MPYRQNAASTSTSTSTGTGNQYTNTTPVGAEDVDNGGTNLMQRMPAANDYGLTLCHDVGDTNTSRKPPSAFPAPSITTAPKRDSGDNAATSSTLSTRRRQSSIPSAKAPMGPRPLDYGTGKRLVVARSFQRSWIELTPASH